MKRNPNVSYRPRGRIPVLRYELKYVGKRTTGTQTGEYLITEPGWKGQVPGGMKQISSPNNSVLVVGRVFVESDSDLPTAYTLAKQMQVPALSY